MVGELLHGVGLKSLTRVDEHGAHGGAESDAHMAWRRWKLLTASSGLKFVLLAVLRACAFQFCLVYVIGSAHAEGLKEYEGFDLHWILTVLWRDEAD